MKTTSLSQREKLKIISSIESVNLPDQLTTVIALYNKSGDRDSFLWKWMYQSVKIITAPFVLKQHMDLLYETKTMFIIFVTLLDDVADKERNMNLLNELVKIPFSKNTANFQKLNLEEKKYFKNTCAIWNTITINIKKFPRYEEFKNLLNYDIAQVLNEMNYAILINENPCLSNQTEFYEIIPYNMQAYVSYTLDLMCSNFDIKYLGQIREIVGCLQKMAKIDNWIATWRREINEKDISNIILLRACEISHLDPKNVFSDPELLISIVRKHSLEKQLLKEWGGYFKKLTQYKKCNFINMTIVLKSAQDFLDIHLLTIGKI